MVEDNYYTGRHMKNYLTDFECIIDNHCTVKGNRINAYNVPKLKYNLIRIFKDFSMWSNVIIDYFKSNFIIAASASVEGYIGKLKLHFESHCL